MVQNLEEKNGHVQVIIFVICLWTAKVVIINFVNQNGSNNVYLFCITYIFYSSKLISGYLSLSPNYS